VRKEILSAQQQRAGVFEGHCGCALQVMVTTRPRWTDEVQQLLVLLVT